MWTRIGIRTEVETLPWSTSSARLGRAEFALATGGLGVPTGDARHVLQFPRQP
jgi:peptide/nickel transport system substrate-binding protein